MYSAANTGYLLPVDEQEHVRQGKLNKSLLLAMDDQFPFAIDVENVLSTVPDRPHQIMDVGGGDGSW
jgi:hypothetical protein